MTEEECRKGVCLWYRVWVNSRDKRRWEEKDKCRRRRDENVGGCVKPQAS